MSTSPTVRPITPDDAGEVLTIQRAAFASEALIYGDPDMPPLTQTLEELRAELVENLGCVAVSGHRIVGAVRARVADDLLLIGRLAIAPDQQGEGLGTLLLGAVEQRGREAGATEAELFTGGLSEANQRLYEREGYHRTEETADGEIFYRKPLA
ncbi:MULTISPECIES: GNAT family N-acetyltransferase [Microbacterium]|uniref:GNAT family N-acetyltransferase n=1 Tax=Microbacterium TaxID=33882 RepID=UPI00278A2C86|nr:MULTISPECIES: GNAT family N-acetyltransferase [Microbacterium]MDQ1084845.1 GNAT superfamily N-acetyltransferase [Microbacterium sp. SORGH_AS_0344]MDQ1169875.1 GNAT superfamily N-acetyltransferase [Microbacterium proteolyticum]